MIDLHTHLLPGIDDGAPDMDSALAMARFALACGTTHLLCTPHLHLGRYDNTQQSIAHALHAFREMLQQAGVALQVGAAAEVRFDSELMPLALAGQLPYLGTWQGRQVLLLEFPHSHIPVGAEQLLRWFMAHGIQPLIAHPERNKGLMSRPELLKPLLAQGCLLQVTASSLAGRFGERAQTLAMRLLKEERVYVLASDAHNMKERPPNLLPGLMVARELIGEAAARRLVDDNPWEISQACFAASAA